jgi:pimeloyl-ACP methyl ester carboxylesterase
MSTFVLVHGAWQTASSWDLVTPRLQALGHAVLTPLLSGLENDSNTLSSDIGLQTHIADVVGLLTRENLHEVTLVGHSYAGMIISGVAEKVSQRLNHLVYVDAFIPRNGQSALDLLPEAVVQMFRRQAETTGNGWLLPAGEGQLDLWGLQPGAKRDFVRARLSDFSLRCFEETIQLPTNAAATLKRSYLACVADGYPARPLFQQFADRAINEGWRYHELPTGHDCHVEMPDEFVSKLLAAEPQFTAQAE